MIKESILNVNKALSRTLISLADYVINPYRGCTFGCIYCYTQYNKNILKKKEKWGDFIEIKKDIPLLLDKELKLISPKKVLMGSTTEIFQYPELKYGITQKILEILKSHNIPFVILTKSYLIKDFAHILSYHPSNKIYFTFMFSDENIRKLFEPNDSSLERRKESISALLKNNVNTKIHIGPFIPYTDDLANLFSLIPDGIKDVQIEIYNSKVGNISNLVSMVKDKISIDTAKKIEEVYRSKENYDLFVEDTKKEADLVNKKHGFNINIVVPRFDSCYNNNEIKY
ncbi:MAG: radical SAM protein [Desulfobacterales bacterium]|nr:radical SAM protein [Desulfobacterales bacterium]